MSRQSLLHILGATGYALPVTDTPDFTFTHRLRVRWGECDAQGIVFNVNYFLYFDVAMTEYMRALGYAFSGDNMLEFFTVNASADYRGSAVFDDALDIGVRCARLGEKSMILALAIWRGGELLTEGSLTYVHAEPGTKNTSPLPAQFIEHILR